MSAGIQAIMNEHDLAIEFRVNTTAQLKALVAGQERIEIALKCCQTHGSAYGRETRAKEDAISDKGFFGKIIGLLVAVAAGIFGRKG